MLQLFTAENKITKTLCETIENSQNINKYERRLMAMGSQWERYACKYSANIAEIPSAIINSSASVIYHHIGINN